MLNHTDDLPMMMCGHKAQGWMKRRDGSEIPACVICLGIKPGAEEIDPNPPSLEGREAICVDCGVTIRPSSTKLAFFEHRPDKEYDAYYCGCYGWD